MYPSRKVTGAPSSASRTSGQAGVLVLPAGKSGHLELGYLIGQGKPAYIWMPEEPDRWDVMYRFADAVFIGDTGIDELIVTLGRLQGPMEDPHE